MLTTAGLTAVYLLIDTLDVEGDGQPVSVICHSKVTVPVDKSVKTTLGLLTFEMVAEPPTTTHVPVPTVGVLADNVVDVPHPISLLGPVTAAVKAAFVQAPVAPHVSTVHGLPSVQFIHATPRRPHVVSDDARHVLSPAQHPNGHDTASHVQSPNRQRSPEPQACCTLLHIPALHTSVVHGSLSLQIGHTV